MIRHSGPLVGLAAAGLLSLAAAAATTPPLAPTAGPAPAGPIRAMTSRADREMANIRWVLGFMETSVPRAQHGCGPVVFPNRLHAFASNCHSFFDCGLVRLRRPRAEAQSGLPFAGRGEWVLNVSPPRPAGSTGMALQRGRRLSFSTFRKARTPLTPAVTVVKAPRRGLFAES